MNVFAIVCVAVLLQIRAFTQTRGRVVAPEDRSEHTQQIRTDYVGRNVCVNDNIFTQICIKTKHT